MRRSLRQHAPQCQQLRRMWQRLRAPGGRIHSVSTGRLRANLSPALIQLQRRLHNPPVLGRNERVIIIVLSVFTVGPTKWCDAECKIDENSGSIYKTRFYERSDWTEMVGKRVRIHNVVKSTREERIQWLKRKKERNIKKRYKRRKQDRERKNIINVKEEK